MWFIIQFHERARASNAELSDIQQERVELIIVLLKTPQI